MKHGHMEQVGGSFARSITGEYGAPAPVVRLIRNKGEFSQFLMDRTLFFDGRFAIYPEYEGGDYFEKYDLIALITEGEHTLESVEKADGEWQVRLTPVDGGGRKMYFLTVEKDGDITGAVLC